MMLLLPMGESDDFYVTCEGAGIALLADGATHGLSDMPIRGGITLHLSPEDALRLGYELIEAAKKRSH